MTTRDSDRQPIFDQVPPKGSVYVSGGKFDSRLLFRAPDGTIYQVPNVPYNQRAEDRAAYSRFMAQMHDEEAARLLGNGRTEQAAEVREMAERCRRGAELEDQEAIWEAAHGGRLFDGYLMEGVEVPPVRQLSYLENTVSAICREAA
jgi:hypothetical protein